MGEREGYSARDKNDVVTPNQAGTRLRGCQSSGRFGVREETQAESLLEENSKMVSNRMLRQV